MRVTLILLFTFMVVFTTSNAQPKQSCTKIDWLLGNWVSTSSTIPPDSLDKFAFYYDLSSKNFVRKSHYRLPFAVTKTKARHNNLIFISPDSNDCPSTAKYIDNEKNRMIFNLSYLPKALLFETDHFPGSSKLRISYTQIKSKLLSLKIEMIDQQGQSAILLEGQYKKL